MISPSNVILSLDTATRCCSVALTEGSLENGRILAEISCNTTITHSRRLLSLIDYLLQEASLSWDDLYGICTGLGPGSFTGLRIGLGSAKGLAAPSGLRFFGVPTLDSFALRCETDKLICSVIDARKQELYAAFYRKSSAGNVERISDFFAATPEKLAEQIVEPVHVVGEGLLIYKEAIRELLGEKASYGTTSDNTVSAAALGLIADKTHEMDISDSGPLYVRASDAELNLQRKTANDSEKKDKNS